MFQHPLNVLHRDDSIVVIDKPPEVLSHPHPMHSESADCIALVSSMLGQRIYGVHRLDRAASGVMVFSLSSESAADLCRQFRDRMIGKRYVALVRGHLLDKVEIDTPMKTARSGPLRDAVTIATPVSRTVVPAPVGAYDEAWYTLAELVLMTGRRHQARRHLARINCPIINDNKHGDRAHNEYYRSRFGTRWMMLRAHGLRFRHPRSGAQLRVRAGLPDWWCTVLKGVGLSATKDMMEETVTIGPCSRNA